MELKLTSHPNGAVAGVPREGAKTAAESVSPALARRALILGYLTYRGDARVKSQVRVLSEAGYEVDVICLADSAVQEDGPGNLIGIKVPRYQGSSALKYLLAYGTYFVKTIVKALQLEVRHPYDVVIACNMPDFLVFCALGPKVMGARIVLDVHDPLPELYRVKFNRAPGSIGERLLMFEERFSASFADVVLATHDLHSRRLERAGVPARKLRTVINAPNPAIFKLSDEPLKRTGRFRLVYHGTISERLGIDVAIRAVGLLRGTIPEIELHLIGRGDALDHCRNLARALELDSCVRFVPPVPVEQLPSLLRQCSVGIVPNRDNAATRIMLPVKLMEYAMLGVPTVAARLDPITQYFDDRSVEFFEADNAADLAKAIVRLHNDPARCADLVREANCTARSLGDGWDANYLRAVG